jgi:hypothetical protein
MNQYRIEEENDRDKIEKWLSDLNDCEYFIEDSYVRTGSGGIVRISLISFRESVYESLFLIKWQDKVSGPYRST